MTADDLLDAIGEIDDLDIEAAEEKPKRRKYMLSGLGSLAACLLLVLFLPNGILHRTMFNNNEVDYAPEDYTSFLVYSVNGDGLEHFKYEIHGGYEEMFFAWKKQNGIGAEVELKNLVLSPPLYKNSSEENVTPSFGMNSSVQYFLQITVSSAFSSYLEKDIHGLLQESLKKTVSSYVGVPIFEMELILTE